MNIFSNLYKKAFYTLFSGLFLLTGAQTARLPIINSVNQPADTINYATNAEEKDHLEHVSAQLTSVSDTYQSAAPISYAAPAQTISAVQSNSITLAGRTLPIFISYDTQTDSGSSVGLYNGRLLYGHNYAGVFGVLPSLTEGTPISVTLNGQTSTYTIARKFTVEKSIVQNYMIAIANARFEGVQYSYALMTCAGTSYGNGDASHRTIVFIK